MRLRLQVRGLPPRALGCKNGSSVSRVTVTKASATAVIHVRSNNIQGDTTSAQDMRQDAVGRESDLAQLNWRSMPGPATVAKSSGLDFIDFIVGMDFKEADHRLRDAVTFRSLVLGGSPAATPAASVGRDGPSKVSQVNLKHLVAFRDHVTRNLAPTIAHGYVKATTTAKPTPTCVATRTVEEVTVTSTELSTPLTGHPRTRAVVATTSGKLPADSDSLLNLCRRTLFSSSKHILEELFRPDGDLSTVSATMAFLDGIPAVAALTDEGVAAPGVTDTVHAHGQTSHSEGRMSGTAAAARSTAVSFSASSAASPEPGDLRTMDTSAPVSAEAPAAAALTQNSDATEQVSSNRRRRGSRVARIGDAGRRGGAAASGSISWL